MGRKPNNKRHKLKALSSYLKDKNHSEFAKSIKISPAHLSYILIGKRKPSLQVANRIVMESEFEVTLDQLRPDLYEEIMRYAEKLKKEVV